MKNNILLLFSTLLILYFVGEIFIRIFFPQDLQRYWVINEKKFGLSVNKSNYTHNLHIFKNHKAKYRFGEYHNRITLEKNLNNKDSILILGDSFTFGWLLNDKHTFIHKLQKKKMNYNFINVAVGAWGSSHYTLFTELYCKKIKPKKILVFMNTDDMYRGYNSGFYKIEKNKLFIKKVNYVDMTKDSKLDRTIPFYKFMKSTSHLFMFTRNLVYDLKNEPFYNPWSSEEYWPRPIAKYDSEYGKKVKQFNEIIFLRLKSISDECGAELNIFFNNWVLPEDMIDENPNKQFLLYKKTFFKENNINFFENRLMMADLYKDPMKYIIDIDFHPNEKGADLLYKSFLKDINKILK